MRIEEDHSRLIARLRARRGEIEQAILTRVHAISDPTEVSDPAYAEGLRAAVSAALDFGLDGIERGEGRPPAVPIALLAQARVAARNAVSLDTVLRRYFAGYMLLGDFLIEEASPLRGAELQRLLRAQATLLDRLLTAVAEEHARESVNRPDSAERRRAEQVERLLSGELMDAAELSYELEGSHLGVVANGPGATEALRRLAPSLDRRLLLVRRERGTVWAWFGGRRGLDPHELGTQLCSSWPAEVALALGEPGEGLDGWRLSHRQASAALSVALRSEKSIVRYAEVAMLAGALQDELLATSLRQIYLAPLRRERDGGETAKGTLRAYFAAQRNVSSAAGALGVSRRTVTSRLRAIEELLGRSLDRAGTELETALRLDALGGHPSAHRPT